MVKVPLFNPRGEFVKTVEVDPAAIAPSVNHELIRQAVLAVEANRRQGTANTKERGEIAGSSKKPWRQKGTGRARAGHKRSPLWRGGGTIFGPHPRDYRHRLPVKARRNACAGALRAKVEDGEVAFIEAWQLDPAKTKTVAGLLKALRAEGTALLGTAELDAALWRCARNIPGVQVLPVDQVNAWHLARHRRVLLTPEGFEKLKGRVSARPEEVAR